MSDPLAPIGALPREQQTIRAKCAHPTGTFVEFERDATEQSIPARFQQMVARYGDRVAVETSARTWTYATLNRRANCIAHAVLRQCGPGPEPVALLLETDPSMIAGILDILKTGKPFVPLAPSWPRARIASVLEDSQAGLVLTDGTHGALAEAADEPRVMDLDALDHGPPDDDPAVSIAPDDFSYIVYTSGSTGHPKGVLQNHRNGLHEAMVYANGLHICAADRLALLYSCHASQGLKITFAALLNGAALYPFDLRRDGVGPLTAWLAARDITVFFSIPAVFRQWVGTFTGRAELPALRLVQLGSDVVTRRDVDAYREHCPPSTVLVLRLGSTEAGTLRTYYVDQAVPRTEHLVPVGYAVDDKDVSLRGEDGTAVAADGVGEITVRSRYLSPGYWRLADLSRETFRPDPGDAGTVTHRTGDLGRMGADGRLYYLGRKDFQVKVNGHRIEVAEIENALLGCPSIEDVVVTAWEDRTGASRLVAYVVPRHHPGPSVSELRGVLRERLPDYMMPAAFVSLEVLPLTPSGKVDRRALPGPHGRRPPIDAPFVPPRTPTEVALASIWAEVLGLDEVGARDPFLELGGDSLAAMQVRSRVIERFDIELPIGLLFEAPTVADLAEVVARCQTQRGAPGAP